MQTHVFRFFWGFERFFSPPTTDTSSSSLAPAPSCCTLPPFFFFDGVLLIPDASAPPPAVPFAAAAYPRPPNGELAVRAFRRVLVSRGAIDSSVRAAVYGEGGALSSRVDDSSRFFR